MGGGRWQPQVLLVCYIGPHICTGGFMRPLGVTLVGFYQILRSVLGLVFGISVMLFTGLAARLASLAAEGNAVENLLRSFGPAPALGIIVIPIPHTVAGSRALQM